MLLRWRGRKGWGHQGLLGFTRIYCSQQQASGTPDGSGVEGEGAGQGQLSGTAPLPEGLWSPSSHKLRPNFCLT